MVLWMVIMNESTNLQNGWEKFERLNFRRAMNPFGSDVCDATLFASSSSKLLFQCINKIGFWFFVCFSLSFVSLIHFISSLFFYDFLNKIYFSQEWKRGMDSFVWRMDLFSQIIFDFIFFVGYPYGLRFNVWIIFF